MLSGDGDDPMTTTDLSKKQLATILSALDDAPRNPANRGEALRAIGRSAHRFGLSTDDVLACAPGLDDAMAVAKLTTEHRAFLGWRRAHLLTAAASRSVDG
jgi:hypothetical protein